MTVHVGQTAMKVSNPTSALINFSDNAVAWTMVALVGLTGFGGLVNIGPNAVKIG